MVTYLTTTVRDPVTGQLIQNPAADFHVTWPRPGEEMILSATPHHFTWTTTKTGSIGLLESPDGIVWNNIIDDSPLEDGDLNPSDTSAWTPGSNTYVRLVSGTHPEYDTIIGPIYRHAP